METKNLVCIVCPNGCSLKVTLEEGKITEVTGNACKRGAEYAKTETTSPVRTLTSSVRVDNGVIAMVPVKSDKPIPKDLILECMHIINKNSVKAPIKVGDVIVENILNTGVNIVATRKVH